jgi:predicted phage tail protein
MNAVLKGAKGGGSQPQGSTEAPDTLTSTARARILDLVSEGPILGFRNGGTNPLQDVYLNETPVANPDGSLNFSDVYIDSRSGTNTQDYMPGFPAVENEFGVGTELKSTAPWAQAINNLDLTAVRIRLSVPSLQQSNASTGDITGYRIAYTIELSTDGGAFVQVVSSAFSGKTSSKYERTHRIPLPAATTGWTVRVTRLTANKNLATVADTTTVESYTEIIDAKLRYPNSALVGIIIDAQQFSNIPTRAYDLYGRIVSVPSNYDPTTRAYTGVWDGSFKPAWTNNPAWIFYDLATHPRYGLGRYVTAALMNKWVLYSIAQYCDQLVPDGRGGQEPRFTCSLYMQTQADAYKVLNDLASVFRGQMYWAGGAIQAVADMPGDPDYDYSPANVINGEFQYAGSGRKTRYTVAQVSWNDPDDFGRAKVETVIDRDGLKRYGFQPTPIIAVGCTSKGQAQRLGLWVLYTARLETETVVFKVGADGIVANPGRIVRVFDPARAGKRQAGRIHSATTTSVVVDQMPDLVAIGDTISCTTSDAVTETRTISAIDGPSKTITVSSAFSEVPAAETMWGVESMSLVAATYRVLSVAEPASTDEALEYTITALRHNASKFDAVDIGAAIEDPPITTIPPPSQQGPAQVVLSAAPVKGAVLVSIQLNIQWLPALGAVKYRVEWRRDNGSWNELAPQTGLSVDLPNADPGSYEARVFAIGAGGNSSLPVYADALAVDDPTTLPTTVEAIQTQANEAATDSSNALAQLAYIASDNTLAQGEKSLVLRDYSVITTEQAGIDAEAARYNITTEKTAYDNAISAWSAYLGTLTTPTLWSDISGDTDIVGATWRAKWTAVYTARQTLLNKILASAKANGDYAVNLGLSAPVVNPTFRNGLDSWTFDTAGAGEWATGSGGNTPDSAQTTFLQHTGVAGQVTTCAHNTGGGIPVKVGQTVTAMVALRAVNPNATARAYVRIGWRNSAGALFSNSTQGVTICTTTAGSNYFVQGVSRVYGTAPAGAVSACVEIEFDSHTSGFYTATSAWIAAGHASADEIPESDVRKWAAESGADVTAGKSLDVLVDGTYVRQMMPTGTGYAWPIDNATMAAQAAWGDGGNGHAYYQGAGPAPAVGSQYLVLQATAAGGYIQYYRMFPVVPGDNISATALIYAASGINCYLAVNFLNAAGSYIGRFTTQGSTSVAWLTRQGSGVVPVGAVKAYLTLGMDAAGYAALNFLSVATNDVRVAGSGARLGDLRNQVMVGVGNYASGWTGGGITYSATTTSATISVAAGTLQIGSASLTYNASSTTVSGSAGATRTYYLYYDDGGFTGGAKTLNATTSTITALAADGRVLIGSVTFTFPTSGTGSGGGGTSCPSVDAWVIRRVEDSEGDYEHVRAGEIEVDDYLLLTSGAWGRVTYSNRVLQPGVRVYDRDGHTLTCSRSAPLELAGGAGITAAHAKGHSVRVRHAGATRLAQIAQTEDVGALWVQHITCENDYFWTGDFPTFLFAHHNLKPIGNN